ncbi:MAG: LysR family transcriptional regulator [Deltaproteobacteria bacterium]|nr:LysR family transcriptional regulator [Deltaproteobacteria bacterium]
MKPGPLLNQLELHHLRALDALLSERNATRAAARLGLTQSALSHSLRSLRDVLEDPLFVRGPGGLVPTPRAEAMAGPLRRALAELTRALDTQARWDPAQASRRFTLVMGDAFALTLLPTLLALVRAEAPGVDLDVRAPPRGQPELGLERLDADLALGVNFDPLPGQRTRALLSETFACIARADHPELRDGLDLDTYCRLPHALVTPRGDGNSVVDTALAKLGRERRVVLRIEYFLAAPLLVAHSDLLLTLPRRLAQHLETLAALRVYAPPLALPGFTWRMLWADRTDEDPACVWLRALVLRAATADGVEGVDNAARRVEEAAGEGGG